MYYIIVIYEILKLRVKLCNGGNEMKINKRAAILCTFLLGAAIFATSAYADMKLGSGYSNLKNSIKTTAEKLTDEVDSFTMDLMVSLKVDGKAFEESINNTKFDIAAQMREENSTSLLDGKTEKYYWYSDKNQNITRNLENDSYNVTEKSKRNKESRIIENPFNEEHIIDAERILDAFVGSVENNIQIEESGGKKIYMGSLKDTEIPSVVNAVSSYTLKYGMLDERQSARINIPAPKSDVHVVGASGKAVENEEGILESFILTASISAKDKKGAEHIYSFEFAMDIKDINRTVVTAPKLDGKQVTYGKEGAEFDEKYIGKYKNDIVELENNSFVKHGERVIEITSVENGNVKGRYYEVYNEGYEPADIRDFEFTSNYDELSYNTILNYRDNSGQSKTGVIHRSSPSDIYAIFDVKVDRENGGYSVIDYDGNSNRDFIRVFE